MRLAELVRMGEREMGRRKKEVDWYTGERGVTEGSDLEVVLYAASLLDIRLDELLRSYFLDDKKKVDGLMQGPLGNFGPKIRIAYLLGLLSPEEAADLDILRELRNDFAHGIDRPVNFDDFKDKIENMEVIRQFLAHPMGCHMAARPLREIFNSGIFILDRYLRDRTPLKRRPAHPPFRYTPASEWPWPYPWPGPP
ncbi:MAG: hypothetical protein ACJ76Y_27265 [Thermoanaerobaculia bacterium]